MTKQVIHPTDQLRQKLSRHQIWLEMSNQHPELSAGAQLVLMDSFLSDITMSDENFSCAEIVRCRISNSHFKDCDFSYSLLIDSVFTACTFINCCFVKADLSGTDASGADFSESDFTRADLTDAIMKGANLTDCLFNWAWLVKTDLRGTILERVQFQGARMVGAKLYNQRKFAFGSLDRAVIKEIDLSPDGNGTKIGGVESIELLRRKESTLPSSSRRAGWTSDN